jgi:hypothetical protein
VSDLISCSLTGCEAGQKLNALCTDFPGWGAEGWGTKGSRFDFDNELLFAGEYIQNWKNDIKANAFGLAHWYLMEEPGETGLGRSFGTALMDFSRIPKFLYYIYRAAWIPYKVKPSVAIANHWNRTGTVRVNAFSNCPKVRLLLNGTPLSEKVPNPELTASDDKSNTSTSLPYQCWWDGVTWAAGTLRAEGLDSAGNVVCFDEKKTAGTPDHVALSVEPLLVKPDGDTFKITANGSDCAFILAKVVDANGLWCPTASNRIDFSVNGPCTYRGGANLFDGANPGDPYVLAEGGMCKVAVRSAFTPGTVTVTATGVGLQGTATLSYTVYPVPPDGPISVNRPLHPLLSLPGTPIVMEMNGAILRYCISKAATVSFEILDGRGRVVQQMSGLRQAGVWHSLSLSRTAAGGETGSGMYLVRCGIDGRYQSVKRVIVMR